MQVPSLNLSTNPHLQQICHNHPENWFDVLQELDKKGFANHEKKLADSYLFLDQQQDRKKYARLLFEVRDLIFRRAYANSEHASELAQLLQNTPLAAKLQNLLNTPKKILPLITKTEQVAQKKLLDGFEYGSLPQKQPATEQQQKRVIHASLEYTGAKVGGIGSFTEQLLLAQNASGQDARIITPFYNTYIEDFPDAQFVGCVNHPSNGEIVSSSIYKVKSQNGKVKQYLLKPDPRYARLMDIGERGEVYASKPHSNYIERTVVYFTSASASFASSFVGGKKLKPFHLLHTQSWTLSLAGELLHKSYNEKRTKAGIDRLAHVNHVHGSRIFEQGCRSPLEILSSLGLEQPKGYLSFNALARGGYTYSDADIHVSNAYLQQLRTEKGGYGLHTFVDTKSKQGRMYGIQNGIDFEKYSALSKKNVGDFAFTQSFDQHGNDTTNYLTQRGSVKQKLFEKGIIPHPTKPLLMFVGRYNTEKGVDMLPCLVDEIIQQGGQCVIMGVHHLEPRASSIIHDLKRRAEKQPDVLRVYDDVEKDQIEPLEGTQIPKGNLIRLATDFGLVPSHAEPCGLVPPEFGAVGAPIVTSGVEGIADYARGFGKEGFNAFIYGDSSSNQENAKWAIVEAMHYWNTASSEEKNHTIGRIFEEAKKYDWKHPNGSLQAINAVYDKACEPPQPKHIREMEEVEQAYNRVQNRSFWNILTYAYKKVRSALAYGFKTITYPFVFIYHWLKRRIGPSE